MNLLPPIPLALLLTACAPAPAVKKLEPAVVKRIFQYDQRHRVIGYWGTTAEVTTANGVCSWTDRSGSHAVPAPFLVE